MAQQLTPQQTRARETDKRIRRAAKDKFLACLLRVLHEQFDLWRMCQRKDCKRARRCCLDEVRCGATRWPLAKKMLLAVWRARMRRMHCPGVAGKAFHQFAPQERRGPQGPILRWMDGAGKLK
ncbi:MAG: hypothetical protein ACJ8F3_14260 [Xanthobacteraceae bacterium]